MNLIFTVKDSEKPDAKIEFNSGAKMLFNRMKALKRLYPKGLEDVSEHFTPAQISFLVAAHGIQETVAQAHSLKKKEK